MDKLFAPPDGVSRQVLSLMREPRPFRDGVIHASNPPQSAPDKIWKEIYGVRKGIITLFERIEGKHIPRSVNPEQIVFEKQ